ncbi:MAG: glycolate oxidase subunit GlcE [Gammaproteobacteria bacterium]|nr:glycolate oxidase subunit GlcE [Gammaproteobacteria bacterium]MBU1787382.1 glycolate oxidase subunit GlcE [Gammaproteobacteria bacterium]
MDSALDLITERIRAAAAVGTPLRIRGGGSKDFYGQSLQGEVLDTRPLSGITSYEPTELVVTVQAGTPLAELEAVLAERGQCLPFEPPHFRAGPHPEPLGEELHSSGPAAGSVATVGGMVGAGLSGPARASVGSLRDYVLGVTMLNGRGELLTFGGQVMKNVAGYDVSRLMAGSLGTLGVMVEMSLKVMPAAPAESTLVLELDEARALSQLNRWAGLPLPINASCWHEGALMLRLRGAQAAVAAAEKTMGGQRMEPATAQQLWAAVREQTVPFFALQGEEVLWRLSVADTAAALGLGSTLIEWGGAQRWIKGSVADEPRVRAAALAAGGHATLFRGGDKSVGVFTPLAPALHNIHQALKKQFDPAGIFNRGRQFADY